MHTKVGKRHKVWQNWHQRIWPNVDAPAVRAVTLRSIGRALGASCPRSVFAERSGPTEFAWRARGVMA